MRALVRRLAGHAGRDIAGCGEPLPKVGFYDPTGEVERASPP